MEPIDPIFPTQSRTIPHGRISSTPRADEDLDALLYSNLSKTPAPAYDTLSAPEPTRSPVITSPALHEGINPGDNPQSFGLAFNLARKAGKAEFSWKGRKFTTDLASDSKPAPAQATLDSALRNGGYDQPTPAALTTRPAIVQELERMRARRTGASGTWDTPQAPEHGASGTWTPENGAIKTLRSIGQVYPVAETAANLATQAVALPVAGIAGIGALAGQAMGADGDPAATVHNVASALTYQPRTDLGQHLTDTTMLPFEQLAKAGRYAGDATLDATGSPIAATAVDTAINALPMMVAPAAKAPIQLHALEKLNTGSLAGKPLRHLSDGLLGGLIENGALSDKARAKVQSEVARRDGSSRFSARPCARATGRPALGHPGACRPW